MVNFHDPAVVAGDFSALVNLLHTFAGLYIWEFAIALGYEWSILWGRRPYLRTIWIYLFTRVATLTTALLAIVDFNLKAPYSCQTLVTLYTISASLALAAAELLLVLRVIAIWNKKKSIKIIAIGVWVINGSFLIQAMSRLRSRRSASDYCLPRNIQITSISTTSTCVTDIVLLLILLVGLLRLRVQGGGMFSLGQLLWKQGIVWFLIATAAGALPTIFLLLDLNDVWSIMFQFPCMVSVSIAATRMYRSLTDFVSGAPDMFHCCTEASPQGGNVRTSTFSQNPAVQPLKRLEVAVHSTRVRYPMAQMSDHGSYADTDGPMTYKPKELTSD